MSLANKLRLRQHIVALQDMADTAALARAGTALPSLEDLASGCTFFGDDVVKDAQKSASDILAELAQMAQEYGEMYAPAPARIQAALRAYAERPTPEIAQGLRDLVLKWRAGWRSNSTHHWLHGYLARVDFHLQQWGDRAAAARVASYVAAHSVRLECTPRLLYAMGVVHESLTVGKLSRDDRYVARLHRLEGLIAVDREAREQMAREDIQTEAEIEDRPVAPEPVVIEDIEDMDTPATGLVVIRSLDHLPKSTRKEGPRAEFEHLVGRALPLVGVSDHLPAMAAGLREQFPWMSEIVDRLLGGLVGRDFVWFQPTVLVGPPGCGKSRFARVLGETLGLPVTVYSVAGEADSSFKGTSRHWSTGRASVPLQAIVRANRANPVIILDEIEKVGTSAQNGRWSDAMLQLAEKSTAARTYDSYLEGEVDLSAVSYLATANSLDGVPGPLRDRFRIIQVPDPSWEHLGPIVSTIIDEIRRERDSDATWLPDLAPDEMDLLGQAWKGGSMRPLRRMVEAILSGRDSLAPRH